jgi:hypothetical protein
MKPTIPEVLDRFKAYHAQHPSWGSLHVVLDDLNLEDYWVECCLQFALSADDGEGYYLVRLLLAMSKTQRRKLARLA